MNKRILYATSNASKILQLRNLLISLPVEILSLRDLGITSQPLENGNTPAENALQKVEFAFPKCGIPTVAVDHGLYIESFPVEKQPGIFVRRISGKDRVASDEEMLCYYQQELDKISGESQGSWTTAIALRIDVSHIYCETFISETFFTSKISPVVMIGEPLNSMQIEPTSGRYFSEMSPTERINAQMQRASGIVQFMEKHWSEF